MFSVSFLFRDKIKNLNNLGSCQAAVSSWDKPMPCVKTKKNFSKDARVTRFGKILLNFAEILKVLGNFWGVFNIWLNLEPTLAKFYAVGLIFIVANGQIIHPSDHTERHRLNSWPLIKGCLCGPVRDIYLYSKTNCSTLYEVRVGTVVLCAPNKQRNMRSWVWDF